MILVKVKYLPPTDRKGARLKVSMPFENNVKVYPFDYSADSAYRQAAEQWVAERKFEREWKFVQTMAYDEKTFVVLFEMV